MSQSTDDFIRSSGNLAYVNTWLKLIGLVLLLSNIVLGGVLLARIIEGRTERVVPIVINNSTGDAVPVDYAVVDAAGEQRSPVEVRKFSQDLLEDLYTYNRFTVRTKLESLIQWTTPEALIQVKDAINLAHRSEIIARNAQGVFELSNFLITESQPLLKVQMHFRAKALAQTGEVLEEGQFLAVLVIRPVKRSRRNPHGLIVIEYHQSVFKEKS